MTYLSKLFQRFRDLPWYGEIGVIAAATFIVSLLVWGGYGLFADEYQTSRITGFSWRRVINIEHYKTVHYSRTSWKRSGAYNSRTWTESYPVTSFSTDANGNMSTSVSIETDRYYEYDRNEWHLLRTVVAAAHDHKAYWPKYELGVGPLGEKNRVRDHEEGYIVHLECEDSEHRESR